MQSTANFLWRPAIELLLLDPGSERLASAQAHAQNVWSNERTKNKRKEEMSEGEAVKSMRFTCLLIGDSFVLKKMYNLCDFCHRSRTTAPLLPIDDVLYIFAKRKSGKTLT